MSIDLSGFQIYTNRADRETILVNGVPVSSFRNRSSVQDLLHNASLVNPLTNSNNVEVINIGQPLEPIDGATAPPYWIDPGPFTIPRGNGDNPGIPEQLPPHLTIEGGHAKFKSLPGYGDAAGERRRVQAFFGPVDSRINVVWDLSFTIPYDDDAPYSASPEYKYPMLIFQHKAVSFPMLALSVETNSDGSYTLYMSMRYSSDTSSTATYRRQYNSFGTGNASVHNQLRYFQYKFEKNQWLDIYMEGYLDERDITPAAGGQGYLNVFINGEQVLAYTGPTLSITDADGSPAGPHSWMVGIYRYEAGAPESLKELDLNRQHNPAPFTRSIIFRRARLLKRY